MAEYVDRLVRRMEEAEAAGNEARAGRFGALLMRLVEAGYGDEVLPRIYSHDLWLKLALIEAEDGPDR